MKLSARNQLKGTVVAITEGVITASVKIEIASGQFITSVISMEALKDLNLQIGSPATAIIKSTSVMLMTE